MDSRVELIHGKTLRFMGDGRIQKEIHLELMSRWERLQTGWNQFISERWCCVCVCVCRQSYTQPVVGL